MLGRADDVVVSGGEKVVCVTRSPRSCRRHPDPAEVVDAAVVGDDPTSGMGPTTRRGCDGPARACRALAGRPPWRWCRCATAGGVARPRGLAVVEEIPRLGSGKTDRRAVTRLAASRSGDASSDEPVGGLPGLARCRRHAERRGHRQVEQQRQRDARLPGGSHRQSSTLGRRRSGSSTEVELAHVMSTSYPLRSQSYMSAPNGAA